MTALTTLVDQYGYLLLSAFGVLEFARAHRHRLRPLNEPHGCRPLAWLDTNLGSVLPVTGALIVLAGIWHLIKIRIHRRMHDQRAPESLADLSTMEEVLP